MSEQLETQAEILGDAIRGLLKGFAASQGTIVFIRCLDGELVRVLCGLSRFLERIEGTQRKPSGWKTFGVVDRDVPGTRLIRSDQAVQLREEKRTPYLFLIDRERAGAGLDGVYTANSEIHERHLFEAAGKLARKRLATPEWRKFAEAALKAGNQRAGTRKLSPRQEFEYCVAASLHSDGPGAELHRLGLWPVDTRKTADPEILVRVRLLMEKIEGRGQTPAQRFDRLQLTDPTPRQRQELLDLFRGMTATLSAAQLARVAERPCLRLPELPFRTVRVPQKIELESWYGKTRTVLKGTGLRPDPNPKALPILEIRPEVKLNVKWTVAPEDLPKGAAEYRVVLTSGDEEIAALVVSHKTAKTQTASFLRTHFEDVPAGFRREAHVFVETVQQGPPLRSEPSEPFVLLQPEEPLAPPPTEGTSSALLRQTLVEGAVLSPEDEFLAAIADPACFTPERDGGIRFRATNRSKAFRIAVPPAWRRIESLLEAAPDRLVRFRARVRSDGEPEGEPWAVPFAEEIANQIQAKSWARSQAKLLADAWPFRGLLGRIRRADDPCAEGYLKEAHAALRVLPELALAHTLEIVSKTDETLALVVLPSHPARVAWQWAYDTLFIHLRYRENGTDEQIRELAATLVGRHVPAFLPGTVPGRTFLFAEMLGFAFPAFVFDVDPEPRATLALAARCLYGKEVPDELQSHTPAAEAIAVELAQYVEFHLDRQDFAERPLPLHLHALRPGDGEVLCTALRSLLEKTAPAGDDGEPHLPNLGFVLNLYPGDRRRGAAVTGRYLADAAERRRTGQRKGAGRDDWMFAAPSGGRVARLAWSRRDVPREDVPVGHAHVAIAFDTFDSEVEVEPLPSDAPSSSRIPHVFGLVQPLERELVPPLPGESERDVRWHSRLPIPGPRPDHPAGRRITQALKAMQFDCARAAAARPGAPAGLPLISTRISEARGEELRRLHARSDWVVTVDRHAAVEYFDSPRLSAVYDAYIIDCVPERDDLGNLQLITSTTDLSLVRDLLGPVLRELRLPDRPGSCNFLLERLKALSGRLAMRAAGSTGPGLQHRELVALALFSARCLREGDLPGSVWPSLTRGFLVPLDDVQDLLHPLRPHGKRPPGLDSADGKAPAGSLRADLLYVSPGPRDRGVRFRVLEIKFRSRLQDAAAPPTVAKILAQLRETRRGLFERYFSADLPATFRAVRRSRLVRVLRFYADKAARHGLDAARAELLRQEIDRLLLDDGPTTPDDLFADDGGFVFCPQIRDSHLQPATEAGEWPIRIFGAGDAWKSPDEPEPVPEPPADPEDAEPNEVAPEAAAETPIAGAEPPPTPMHEAPSPVPPLPRAEVVHPREVARPVPEPTEPEPTEPEPPAPRTRRPPPPVAPPPVAEVVPPQAVALSDAAPSARPHEVRIRLGRVAGTDLPVHWEVGTAGNPHLMIVGTSGAGKTNCLKNICRQFVDQGVMPIVFSYHPDIDDYLKGFHPGTQTLTIDRLGFNPLELNLPAEAPPAVLTRRQTQVAGELKDVFASVFPQLGELQQAELRQAVKHCYLAHPTAPPFESLFERLKADHPKSGVTARLEELHDFGFFTGATSGPEPLDSSVPTLIQLHDTGGEEVQRVYAAFMLYRLHRRMSSRGVHQRLTHAVIFDEAHKAGHLTRLVTLAKECRKFGIALLVASQESRDFDRSLYSPIQNYLLFRITEYEDAKKLAQNLVSKHEEIRFVDRLKQLRKFHALRRVGGDTQEILLDEAK